MRLRNLWRMLCFALVCGAATAQENAVELQSKQGELTIRGAILDYDGRYFSIDSEYGNLVLDGRLYACQGTACPDMRPQTEHLNMAAPAGLTRIMLPGLIENFALRRAYSIEIGTNELGDALFRLTSQSEANKQFTIALQSQTPAQAIEALIAGETDWAIAFRELYPRELDILRDPTTPSIHSSIKSAIIALDALVPVKAPPSSMEYIDLSDLISMITSPDDNIRIAREYFGYGARFGWQGFDDIWHDGDNTQVVQDLISDPEKLALVPFSDLSGMQVVSITGDCGHMPRMSNGTIKKGDFPLGVPIFLHQSPFAQGPQANEFFEFVSSVDAQLTIERAGFVGMSAIQTPLSQQGERLGFAISRAMPDTLPVLQSALQDLAQATRLSTSFRFAAGAATLDAQSQANIDVLVRSIYQGLFRGRDIIFAGFSDNSGSFDANVTLSQDRAETVMRAVISKLPQTNKPVDSFTAKGFGPVLPMACETTALGQDINRRVEVWIK